MRGLIAKAVRRVLYREYRVSRKIRARGVRPREKNSKTHNCVYATRFVLHGMCVSLIRSNEIYTSRVVHLSKFSVCARRSFVYYMYVKNAYRCFMLRKKFFRAISVRCNRWNSGFRNTAAVVYIGRISGGTWNAIFSIMIFIGFLYVAWKYNGLMCREFVESISNS